jgi:hypothetical protein
VRWFVGLIVYGIIFPVLTVVLGVPAALYLVAKRSKGGLLAFAGWVGASSVGWLPQFAGPFGMPTGAFWPAAVLFGVWFGWAFWVLGRAAWGKALRLHRLVRDYGMPPSEIL